MHARVVFERYGAPDVLQLIEIADSPVPAGNEVRVRVAAAALNPTDPRSVGVSFDQAAALPTAGEAALRAYRATGVTAA